MNRNQKSNIYLIVGFLILSIGLFSYQNFFMPAQEKLERVTIYVAGEDISHNSPIDLSNREQIKAIDVDKDSVIPGSVTDIASLNGQFVKGGLLAGELITHSRISPNDTDEGSLYIKVEPDFSIDIRDGENVRAFIQGTNEASGQIQVVELFHEKKVYSGEKITKLFDGEAVQGYYIKVTDDELKDYYKGKYKGEFILAKIASDSKDVTDLDIKSTGNLDDLKTIEKEDEVETEDNETTSTESNENNEDSVFYEVKEDDTFESIAHRLEISVDELKELNSSYDELNAGDVINIPANE